MENDKGENDKCERRLLVQMSLWMIRDRVEIKGNGAVKTGILMFGRSKYPSE
jgi:hypothetical protein